MYVFSALSETMPINSDVIEWWRQANYCLTVTLDYKRDKDYLIVYLEFVGILYTC